MASTYIYKDMIGNTPSTKMTYSGWIKRVNPNDNGRIFGAQSIACHAYFGGSDGTLNIDFATRDSSTIIGIRKPSRLFRDTNAFYHIVFALDTTQGTADDRIKLWINGVQETSFTTKTNPSQNATTAYGDDGYYSVGARMIQQGGAGHYFDGVMSHVHYCDGYAYQASDFGEYDANGVWKIKTSPSVSYGANGFFILKDGNSATDQSGNGNDLTVSGTLTNTEDSPSNVFATFNPLHFGNANSTTYGTFSNGNTSYASTQAGSPYPYTCSTLAASSGKWYAEFKLTSLSSSSMVGITDGTSAAYIGDSGTNDACLYYDGRFYPGASSFTSAFADNDIVQIAMDLDNNFVYFGKNGTWLNSGDPTSGASGTGAKTIPTSSTGVVHFAFGDAGGGTPSCSANFGNGYFGTSAISSAGTNASGNGIFEYDVPTGYTALSTKGLNL